MKLVTENSKKAHKRLSIGRIAASVGILIFVLVMAVLIFCFVIMNTLINGPSHAARDIFVTTCMETSFAKYFPPLYLSDKEILEIQKANSIIETNEVTSADLSFEEVLPDEDGDGIEVFPIVGATYKGNMMVINDPSRVILATPASYGVESSGEKLDTMMEKVNAVAGINGGGFVDESGRGNGGLPLGVVIKNSAFMQKPGGSMNVVGFDINNVLHVGTMTTQEMEKRKIRDAVSFGPTLIVNSNPAKFQGNSGGLNPRSAIGQRADGAVLLLSIDGRQSHSLGANYRDMIDIMVEYGAVNAGNLDGGSSSMLYYNGELINTCASLYGPRKIPNAFVVKPQIAIPNNP